MLTVYVMNYLFLAFLFFIDGLVWFSCFMRASRLLSILILLQLQGRVRAQALADEFEVSLRSIYRDIDELSAAGIPIQSERGPNGGFQLMEGYRQTVGNFEYQEAEALCLIGLPGPAMALGMQQAATHAKRKVQSLLPPSLRQQSDAMAKMFHLDVSDWYQSQTPLPELPKLARALVERRQLAIRYESWTAVRSWTLEGLGLVLKAGTWYLVARGSSQKGKPAKVRTFKVANINTLEILEQRYTPPEEFDLALYWDDAMQTFERQLRGKIATIELDQATLTTLASTAEYARIAAREALPLKGKPDRFLLQLPYENDLQGARLMLSLGGDFEVLEPISLRQQIHQLAARYYQLHCELHPELHTSSKKKR
ncbi:YafY family protein [Undibacterium cyanobacteriorum]|uniref:YafY family protein n=1 Tax=Undibacterium cyanobacteriorum TaxID=3073561 RepID=A0ABY9RI74_9BURK|nr:YafY family protein [Undibacterium sp. 20NA77.5]WMW80900.1 YafY family protein [Undibacterium sp. 20NA77.5]